MTFLFGIAAFIYSLAGHAGASLYGPLAMASCLRGADARSAALWLNLLVAGIGVLAFGMAGKLRLKLMGPLLLGSLPFCFLGSRLLIHSGLFSIAMGLALLGAALRIVGVTRKEPDPGHSPGKAELFGAGAALGLLSGLTGIGGGIYLSSLFLFKRWAGASETAGAAACFIFANSAVSLAATGASAMPRPEWIGACLLGGILGASIGSRLLSARALWRAQAAVALLAAIKLLVLR